jgi:Trypsin-co-occurring domain 2
MEQREVPLSEALEALRDGLEDAWKRGQGRQVRFAVSEVTLTLETVVNKEKEGSAGIRWYVVQAGGAARSSTESTQTLVLTLTPGLYDEDGIPSPLPVGASRPRPAQ